jgi:hypothetical protein
VIAITTYATKNYCYALGVVAQRIAQNIRDAKQIGRCFFVMASDDSEEAKIGYSHFEKTLSDVGCETHRVIISGCDDDHKDKAYKDEAQRLIARLQTSAWDFARSKNPDLLWSVESDVIPPENALKVLKDTLGFDDGYYDIAMVTYPNGKFLGGRGTYRHQIAEDFLPEERSIPKELEKKIKKRDERFKDLSEKKEQASEQEQKEWQEMDEQIKQCPPKGNVFELNAKRWRKRGWLDMAYPAVGRGAILPTDWVGLGCTLISKRALSCAFFDGYQLKGTQDLFLCWNQWHPRGYRMAVVSHILCSHVKRARDKDGKQTRDLVCYHAYHEPDGELEGHIRMKEIPFIDFTL